MTQANYSESHFCNGLEPAVSCGAYERQVRAGCGVFKLLVKQQLLSDFQTSAWFLMGPAEVCLAG